MADDEIDRMGAFDAVMWGIEQDPIVRSPIVAMVVLDGEPNAEVLVDRVTRMTLAVPRLRQRVIGNPISLVPPRWEVVPDATQTQVRQLVLVFGALLSPEVFRRGKVLLRMDPRQVVPGPAWALRVLIDRLRKGDTPWK